MASHDAERIAMQWGIRIPLRDGIELCATIYRPLEMRAAAPAILAMTPYIADVYHDDGVYFAARGLPFVVADVRGRGNSQGDFRPGIQEAADALDAVEWLARQPFCDGKVGMFGGSYSGYVQWAAASRSPPHLTSLVPIAATCFATHAPMRNTIFYPERLRWLVLTSGRTRRTKLHADQDFWSAVCRRWLASGRPFRELDTLAANPSPIFQEWLSHPEPDAYWDAFNPSAAEYARLNIPILTITGSYDVDQPGALAHYRRHMSHAGPQARAQHYLIIGPWNHSASQLPRAEFGGLRLAPPSVVNLRELHRKWYAWTMQAEARPEFLQKNVAYYVMGAERWRYVDVLDEATARHDHYGLASTGKANDPLQSGLLARDAPAGPPDTYTYDPRAIDEAYLESEGRADDASLFDQSLSMALSGRLLAYHSAPLADAVEITGFFKLHAWLSIDCPDTDFHVSIHEVFTDGAALLLSTDVQRARYREGLRAPKLISTGKPQCYTFDSFTFVSRRIERGHRLRLVIAPIGRIDTGFVQINYNAGGVVADERAIAGRPVTVKLFHDGAHPSALLVPIGA